MGTNNNDVVELTEQGVSLARRLQAVRDQQKELRKEEEVLRDSLLSTLEDEQVDAAVTGSGEPAIHLVRSNRSRVDTKRLQAMYPDIHAEVTEQKESITLKVDLSSEDREAQVREALGLTDEETTAANEGAPNQESGL